MRIAVAASVVGVVLMATFGGASERADLESAFRAWDSDGDGRLTAAEWRGRAPFERADRNGDGFVTLGEVTVEPPEAKEAGTPEAEERPQADEIWARMISGWDSDGNGALETAEWRGRTPHGNFDGDGDGSVTRDEFASAVGGPEQEEKAPVTPSWERAVKGWDEDADGELSEAEWRGRTPYESLDADGDGRLTESEFTASLGGVAVGAGDSAPQQAAPASQAGPSEEFEMLLRAMDNNRDGKVSHEEWNGGASDWQTYDQDGDGFITTDEVP